MSPGSDVPRQSVLSPGVVGALMGEVEEGGGIVADLVDEQLREEREQQRKHPVRPTEQRRRTRQLSVTFSKPDTVLRLRALAERWCWLSNNGRPNVSKVVEYLLLPQLEAAERGEIGPPSIEQNEPVSGKIYGGQWF